VHAVSDLQIRFRAGLRIGDLEVELKTVWHPIRMAAGSLHGIVLAAARVSARFFRDARSSRWLGTTFEERGLHELIPSLAPVRSCPDPCFIAAIRQR
jgi:hypothetical protein